jgi:hypothetical protein
LLLVDGTTEVTPSSFDVSNVWFSSAMGH